MVNMKVGGMHPWIMSEPQAIQISDEEVTSDEIFVFDAVKGRNRGQMGILAVDRHWLVCKKDGEVTS